MNRELSTSARSRARTEITAELLEIARRQLADTGAASLSLRAIAREAGMVSSAIYRYYPSRDDLLTALIVSGYEDLADAVVAAESEVRRNDYLNRWRTASRSVRTWAQANPHDYGLLYGTPVPGYVAPSDTIAPVVRLSTVLTQILIDANADHRLSVDSGPKSNAMAITLGPTAELFKDLPPTLLARGLVAWSALFGAVSFEMFGHLNNVVTDHDAFFEFEIDRLARDIVGLVDAGTKRRPS